jgi:multiple antibiotic resistance protein
MNHVLFALKFIPLSFNALLPVINPVGSAMVFLGLVGDADHETRKHLARSIAINTVWFLLAVQVTGSYVLRFFGISLGVVEVAGGLALASMGWSALNEPEADSTAPMPKGSIARFHEKVFYPLTFPITAGPGCIVVALTLGAHASRSSLADSTLAHLGLLIGIILIAIAVYFSYAYADTTTAKLSPSVAQGVRRVVSFILVCIGGEVMWDGIRALLKTASS